MVKRENEKIWVVIVILASVVLAIFFMFMNEDASEGLCEPGILCLDDTLTYRSLTCGLLVNTNPEVGGVCENGRLAEEHPLVRTTIGGEQPLLVVDTALLDLEEEELTWEYYPLDDIPREYRTYDEVYTSPPLHQFRIACGELS